MTTTSIRFNLTPWHLSLIGVCRLFDAGYSTAAAYGKTLNEIDAELAQQIRECFAQHHHSGAFVQQTTSATLQ